MTSKDFSTSLKIASTYTAVILGAGFASGRELLSFFAKYDKIGIIGLIVSGLIFSFIGYAVLQICFTNKIYDYSNFLRFIAGNFIGGILDNIVIIFLFVLYSTMLAASGATAIQEFNIPYLWGVILLAAVCFITMQFGQKGINLINSVLAPIMLVGGIYIGLYTFFHENVSVFSQTTSSNFNWLKSSIVYASYNVITGICILTSISNMVTNKNVAKLGVILGGICMTILGISMTLPLISNYTKIHLLEIPLAGITQNYDSIIKAIYIIVFTASVFTTAIGNLFALIEQCHVKTKFNKTTLQIAITIMGIIFSKIGFAEFINLIYPIFGYVGLFQIILIFIIFIRKM